MNIPIRTKLSEKLASVDLDASVQNAIETAKNMGATKIAVYDQKKNYWVISLWRLSPLDPKISFKQAYDEKKEIFEKVDTVSIDEEVAKVISKLYKFPGLIVIDGEKIIGFISLADFSDFELKQIELSKKPSLTREQIEQKVRTEGLVGVDLRGANLIKANLSRADLRGVNLNGADLSKSNLWEADLTGADLSNANLTEAKLRFAKLNGAKLKNTILNGANLKNAQLWHSDLEKAKLEYADLTYAHLYNANLNLSNLKHAKLYNAGLMSAKLYGADLSNSDLRNANLKYAHFDEKTKLNDIEINDITIYNITDEKIKKFLKEKYCPFRSKKDKNKINH